MKTNIFLALFSLLTFSIMAQNNQTLSHVEPPNWWANMEHHQVEVMLHGKNISHLTVEVKGLTILGIQKTENPNYIFVTIETKNVVAGKYTFQLSENKKVKYQFDYDIKARNANSKERIGFSTSDVLYLLMPDRFANGKTTNDNDPSVVEKMNRSLPGGRHGGDIQGIVDHLDYIKELGATTIWPTPMMEDNDSAYSYHTYGQSDLYRVDPRYGTNEEYKNLVTEAHKRKLKVIQDVVPNHWGSNHWMMRDLPTYTWLHQFPGYAQTNYRMSTQMDPNTSQIDQKMCADGWFVKSMPDLNQSNPLVLNYLIQNTIWWMEYADLDGLRVDTYSYNDKDGIAKWTKKIMEEYPNTNIVGEVWMHDQAHQSYWQKNSPIAAIQSYNSNLPSVMDFTLHDAFGQAFNEKNQNWDQGMMRVYDNFVNDFMYDNPNNILLFMENHDTQRFNEIYSNIKDYKLGMTILATVRGIPQIYYGTEIGMKGNKNLGDADIRKDFPGGWKEDKENAFAPKSENQQVGRNQMQEEYFNFTKKILNWRLNNKAVQEGKTVQFIPENNVYVFFRILANEKVMVIVNNSESEQTLNLKRFREVISKGKICKDFISGNNINLENEKIIIGAKTSMIIEIK